MEATYKQILLCLYLLIAAVRILHPKRLRELWLTFLKSLYVMSRTDRYKYKNTDTNSFRCVVSRCGKVWFQTVTSWSCSPLVVIKKKKRKKKAVTGLKSSR